jgi:hypothetical protein
MKQYIIFAIDQQDGLASTFKIYDQDSPTYGRSWMLNHFANDCLGDYWTDTYQLPEDYPEYTDIESEMKFLNWALSDKYQTIEHKSVQAVTQLYERVKAQYLRVMFLEEIQRDPNSGIIHHPWGNQNGNS